MKLRVIHFQRKPRTGFNYSIESIFGDLRSRLKDRIQFSIAISSRFNDGYVSKFYNTIEAFFRQNKYAVNHITGEVYFLNLLMHKKHTLLTIHDCRFMERKKGFEKKMMQWLYLKAPVCKSLYVTTVSETTKKDVICYTGCNAEKIKVIPNAVKTIYQPHYKVFNQNAPVILQIGTAENKNLERLIEALAGMACCLIIIGRLSIVQIKKLELYNVNYVNRYDITDTEMLEQYQQCDILAFVSTFEGFGMPIIEANCVERAVITSNISSMPEVAGDAACLVNPYDVKDIRNGILKLIDDTLYREQVIGNGRKNRLRFNGDVIAEQYFQLYKKMSEHFKA